VQRPWFTRVSAKKPMARKLLLSLAEVTMDQKKRIEQLEAEVRKRGGILGGIDNLPPEIVEDFLKRVLAVDDLERLRDDEETKKKH